MRAEKSFALIGESSVPEHLQLALRELGATDISYDQPNSVLTVYVDDGIDGHDPYNDLRAIGKYLRGLGIPESS